MPAGFFERVYAVAARIPEGKVTTYGDIARAIGSPRGARVVGFAMAAAPRERRLPCHRVVNAKGCLTEDAFGGMQRAMLEMEGVPFKQDGFIDLSLCRWDPTAV